MDTKDRIKKNRQLWNVLGGMAFLFAAFWGLNFRVTASNTSSEKNITTTSIGEELPYAMQRREKINLALVGEGSLVAALQKALTLEINKAGIGEMELVQGTAPKYPSPVLVIKWRSPELLWTPFFATSWFTIQSGYSSTGDTAFLEETPVTIDNRDGPALNMYGEYTVRDYSWGLISRPGYYQILANYLAQQIVITLKELYRVST
jgi:hypothetical protein